jgi:hypothetical protein
VHRAGVLALVGAVGIALLFSPVKLCLMALALRLPCPGCGMTRATMALLQGDFARAFALHPLSPVIVPLAMGLIFVNAVGYVRTGGTFGTTHVPRSIEVLAAALVILLFGIWLARFFGYFGGPVSLR